MAYGLKYYFVDKKIVTSTTVTYRFEILQENYTGSATEWNGVSIQRQYEESSLRDIKSIQKGSVSGTIRVEDATQRGVIETIAGSQIGDYKVQLKKDNSVVWTGYVVPDLINISEENYRNQTADIVAKDLLFTGDFTLDTGDEKAIVLIADILDTLGYGLNITSYTSWTDTTLTTTDDILNQSYHKKDRLRIFAQTDNDEDRALTNEQALEYILKAYGIILRQANGTWNLIQISAFETTSAVRRYIYNSSGSQTSSETDYQLGSVLAQGDLRLFGATSNNYYAGVKKVESRFDHNTNIQGIKLNREYWITDGSDITKSQFIQSDGTGNIELFFVTWFAKTTAIDLGNPNVLDVQIYVDTASTDYYWNGTAWQTTPTTIDIDVEATYSTQDSDDNYVHKNNGVSIVTTGIPDGSDGTLYVKFITDELIQNYAYWYLRSVDLKVAYSDQVGGVSEGIEYELVQTGSYSHIYDYGTYYYGGGPTSGALSALRDSSGDLLGSWKRSTDSSATSHAELLLRERLDIMRGQRRNMRGVLYGEYEPDKALNYDSTVFFFLGGSWDSSTYQWNANFIELDVDTATDDDFNIFYITEGEGTTSGSVGSLSTSTGSGSLYLEKSKNLQDVTSASTARTNLGLGATSDVDFGQVTGSSFVKENGQSDEFLKADGSVDDSTYLTQSDTDALYDDYNYFSVSDGSSTFNVGSQQTMSITASGASSLTYDTETRSINISSTDTNTDTNHYLNTVTWDSGTGVLSFDMIGTPDFTVDIDGRYLEAHPTIANVPSDSTNTDNTVIQSLGFDTFGHVDSVATKDFTNVFDKYSSWTATVGTDTATIGSADSLEFRGGDNVTIELSGSQLTINASTGGDGDITAVNTDTNSGLAGGVTSGSADLSLNITNLPTLTASGGSESIAIQDGNTTKNIAISNISLSHFNDDLTYLTSETSHDDVVVDGDFTANGLMKRTALGTYATITDSSSNWNTGYNRSITSVAFDTGTGVLTLNQQNGGTVTKDLDGRYLPLSGGTLTGTLTVQAVMAQSNAGPKFQLIETDEQDLNKEIYLNGGDFFVRNLNDDGTNPTGENILKISHAGVVTLLAQGTTNAENLNALFQNSDGVLKRRTLGSNAFNSTTIPTNNNQLTNGAGYITSFDITTQTDPKYLRSDASDTTTGNITISKDNPTLTLVEANSATGSYPRINFDTQNNQGVSLYHSEFDSELTVDGYGLVLDASSSNTQFPTTGTLTFSVLGEIYAGGTSLGSLNKVFHDGYHPNADTLTTSRTITLGGDLTGSASFDGSADITISAQVSNNSHTHDDRYLQLSGGTLTGSVDSNSEIKTTDHFTTDSGELLNLNQSSWANEPNHYVLYNAWTSSTGDYLLVKASGNATGEVHGTLLIADNGLYYGKDGAQESAEDSATAPLDTTLLYFRSNGSYINSDLEVSGDIETEEIKSVAYPNNNFLKFNDDQTVGTNMVTLGSLGKMNFIVDSNGNDTTSHFRWATDGVDMDTNTTLMTLDDEGNLSIESGDVDINGTLTATVKSFDIKHPTQDGKRLVYGVLEGPEHAVFYRGRSNSRYIELPEEWTGLIDPETITVQLTPASKPKTYYYKGYKDNKIEVGVSGWNWNYDYFYIVHATRIDVEPLQTVQDAD